MEQLKRFLRDKGFALALLACLVAAAAAGVWAVRTVRDELKENLDGLNEPDSTSTLPGIDEDLTIIPEEEYPEWQQPTTPAANSVANVPKADPAPKAGSSTSSCCLVWAGVWLWFGARTLRLARRILACQQFGSACFHAAHLWQSVERLQRR